MLILEALPCLEAASRQFLEALALALVLGVTVLALVLVLGVDALALVLVSGILSRLETKAKAASRQYQGSTIL